MKVDRHFIDPKTIENRNPVPPIPGDLWCRRGNPSFKTRVIEVSGSGKQATVRHQRVTDENGIVEIGTGLIAFCENYIPSMERAMPMLMNKEMREIALQHQGSNRNPLYEMALAAASVPVPEKFVGVRRTEDGGMEVVGPDNGKSSLWRVGWGKESEAADARLAKIDEVAPAPEHDAHLLHWIACPDGSPPMVWTWNAADRSWHWYDQDCDCTDGYENSFGYNAAQKAYRGGFRYLCPAVPPSQTPDLPEGEAEFLNAARDLSGGSF